ncbi:MAG: guanylate kinase [Oscillospiraceae bacterium]|nr:guanylate kinase [Oscillospiraceae bacterium]
MPETAYPRATTPRAAHPQAVVPPGLLLILSGPSGSGKGTIVKSLLAADAQMVLSVSVTTRAPRPGEVEGVHYFFRTREEFERLIAAGALLEYADYNGEYYGTPEAAVDELLAQGKHVLLEIEVHGAEQVMDKRADTVPIFITAPSVAALAARLRARGTETAASLAARLAVARYEYTRAYRYSYVVLNDEVDKAVARILAIIDAESMRTARMKDILLEVEKQC